ncbi:hypothetical protein [Vibrio phage VP4B]|uniref:Nudix hydrolase domain-containing protein n=1 Tax=Vibrio phage VP4B TaxID=1262540 RepID=V9LZY3_9CAUD|nr:MutT/NUDIX hydrolase [Vibrio phage VP4B]AGB07151.1 hypothetical protein [Vibrio phage VP4B]
MLNTVGALIKNDEGKILVQMHVKIGGYTVPSGKLEAGETLEQGLRRELLEEIGVSDLTILDGYHHWFNTYPNLGNVEQNIFTVEIHEEPRNMEPDRHSYLGWMSPDEILTSGKHLSNYLTTILEKETTAAD